MIFMSDPLRCKSLEVDLRTQALGGKAHTRFFYYRCLLFALFFPLVVVFCDYFARPRVFDIMEYYVFEELLIGWGINLAALLPAMILPVLTLPCMFLLYGVLLMPTVAFAGYYLLFKQRFGFEISKFLWDTNLSEALEFLKTYLSPLSSIALAVVVLLPLVMIFFIWRAPRPKNTFRRVVVLITLLLSLQGCRYYMSLHLQVYEWYIEHIRVHFFKYYAIEYYKYRAAAETEAAEFRFYVEEPVKHFPLRGLRMLPVGDGEPGAKGRDKRIAGVIVIGESASRLHQGIYGYFRNTTPHLDIMSNDLFIFRNVESVADATKRSLLGAFSFVDSTSGLGGYKCSIIDILNRASFETIWITNPLIEGLGDFARATPFIRRLNANVQVYHGLNVASTEGKHLDIEAVPVLKKTLSSNAGRDLGIFIHLNGSHAAYANRYPADYDHFGNYPDDAARPWLDEKNKRVIDAYDNSILYTDFVLSEIIQALQDNDDCSFLLYFADHGDDVYRSGNYLSRRNLDTNAITEPVKKVPCIMWFSESYKKRYPQIVAAARQNDNKFFVLDDLIWTMTELYGLTFDGFEESKSLVNALYGTMKKEP